MSKKICNVAIKMQAKNTETEEVTLDPINMGPRTFLGVWKDWFIAIGKWIWSKFHSPMGIYIFATWLISILIMGITNSLRGPEHTFWEGPSYWMSVFLTYGLNGGQDPGLRFIAKPILVWFFAPMVSLILGSSLFLLADSGFFRNGANPVDELDFAQSHRFYSMDDIWGSELISISNPKWTIMYFWIVLAPIVLGAVVTGTYNFIMFKLVQKKKKYLPSAKSFLLLTFLGSIITGTSLALMTGNITLKFRDLLFSLFVDRKSNNFLIYGLNYANEQGQYHPIAVAFSTWLIYLIPFLVIYAIFLIVGNLDKIWKNRNYLYNKITYSIESRKTPLLDFQDQLTSDEYDDKVDETST
ncbi:MAG: hypothetical protein KGD64_02875 [Candidatus Heimdallarchaeota archaeon]|nr:hypothetical protein [Candidatus Heimdallarchaeota archaeon]